MKRKVIKDILKIMWSVIAMNTFNKIILGYLVIFTGSIIGSFAEAAINGNKTIVKESFIALLIASAITILIIPFIRYIANCLLFKASLKYERFIVRKFISKSYKNIINYDVGEISYRLEMDANELMWALIIFISTSVATIVVALGLFINLFNINGIYALACIFLGAIPVLIAMISSSFEKRYELQRKEYEQKSRDMQSDIFSNFKFIKVYGIKEAVLKDFSNTFSLYYEKTIKRVINCSSVVELSNNLCNLLCQVAILLLGAVLVSTGKINSGAIAAMMIYFSKVQDMYKDICDIVKNCRLLPQCLDRVGEFYLMEEASGKEKLKDFSVLQAENIGYKFHNSKKVFGNISFTIKKGDKVAIIGSNGSGKSTLLKIISRLYDDYEGSVKINGTKLQSFDLSDFRNNIAYMEQDPFLFTTDIYNNIAIGNIKESKEELEKYIEKVGLAEIKYKETKELGSNLSGGEKQRVSIARALIRDSNILLMDEPFNNLDSKGRELIEEILRDESKTIIFITHDYELLKYADFIVDMGVK